MLDGICVKGPKDCFVEAFVKEAQGTCYYPEKFVEGFEKSDWKNYSIGENPLVIQGILRGTEDFILECNKKEHPYFYLDHAYFHATRDYRPGEFGLLYRVNYSELNTSTLLRLNSEDYARIEKYKTFKIKTKQENTTHVLVFPPTEASARVYNIDLTQWRGWIEKNINKHTNKPVIFREKGTRIPLQQQLKGCHAVVSINSTAAIEAVLQGVPSFAPHYSPAAPVSNLTMGNLKDPWFPQKHYIRKWTDSLLATQFTFEEIESGLAYKTMKRLYNEK